jgi:lysophospholipase L1-like esterase
MSTDRPRRRKHTLLKFAYLLIVVTIGLAVLEGGARYLGLGDPVLYYNDAWGGLRPLPSQRVSRLKGATVTVDGNGYRTPVPDQPGAMRILYLGDSVTWGGSSVDDTELFSEVAADVLRAQGRPVYAMNAGVNSTSLLNQAGIFQGYDGKLDVLVWLFPWGDTERTYVREGELFDRFKPKFALVEVIDYLVFKYWRNLFRETSAATRDFRTPEAPAGRELFFKNEQAKRQVRNLDAVRTVVAEVRRRGVPVVLGVKGNELEPLPPEAVSFLAEMAAAGATVFDVSAVLREAPAGVENIYLDVVHFKPEGHHLIGEALGKTLETVIPTDGR